MARLAQKLAVPTHLSAFAESDDGERAYDFGFVPSTRGSDRVLGCKRPKGAWRLIEQGCKDWRKAAKR